MMRPLPKFLFWIMSAIGISAILLFILSMAAFVYIDMISGNDAIYEGTAYGLTIGSTKEEAYEQLRIHYHGESIEFLVYYIPEISESFQLDDPAAKNILIRTNFWRYRLNDDDSTDFELNFRNGKLFKIYRSWGTFRMP